MADKLAIKEPNDIRCICYCLYDDGFLIMCDKCNIWQHAICMGLSEHEIPENYFCEQCVPREVDRKRAIAIQIKRGNTSQPNVGSITNNKTAISLIPCERNENDSVCIRRYTNEIDHTKYAIDEDVLVFEGFAMYEATIVEIRDEIMKAYKVHYFGWGDQYDEWVDATCLAKKNPTSLRIKCNLNIGKKSSQELIDKVIHGQGLPENYKEYKRGNRLIVYSDKLLYHGIVKSQRVLKKQLKYLIDYPGWNKVWREWVEPYRLFDYTPTAKLIKERLDFYMDQGQKGGISPFTIEDTSNIASKEVLKNTKIEPMENPTVIIHSYNVGECSFCLNTNAPNSHNTVQKWINCGCGKKYHESCVSMRLLEIFKSSFTCNTIEKDCKFFHNCNDINKKGFDIDIENNLVHDGFINHSDANILRSPLRPNGLDFSQKEIIRINVKKNGMGTMKCTKQNTSSGNSSLKNLFKKRKLLREKTKNKQQMNFGLKRKSIKALPQLATNCSFSKSGMKDETYFKKIISEQLSAAVNELYSTEK